MKIQGIRSHKFLPLAIQFHMWLYAFLRGKKFIKTCNHWSVIIGETEYEAIGKGVVKKPYIRNHHYIKEWEISTIHEADVVRLLESRVGKKYEFMNFLFHIFRVWFGGWWGSYSSESYSCIELTNEALKVAGYSIPKYFNPYETQTWLGDADYEYHADNESTFLKFTYWFLDRSTYIMLALMAALIIWLTITGKIFRDLDVTNYF